MVGVMRRAVHQPPRPLPVGHREVAVMDGDGPHVDCDKHAHPQHLVHREDEDGDVVGKALDEPVEWVEGVRGKGAGDLPLVVRLVDVLVEHGQMKPAVEPVDEAVSEHEEGEDGEDEVGQPEVAHVIVQARVSLELPDGDDRHQQRHLRDRAERQLQLERHLPGDPLLVLHPLLVEEEVEVEGGWDQVHQRAADAVDEVEVDELADRVVARHRVLP
mmetsp:Transcript_21602/g.53776  ORF Transcript_21602/g.53776 Transcript_21602/m.53776 type:complete len:216 (+) Transcript_21602:505-1152(+)